MRVPAAISLVVAGTVLTFAQQPASPKPLAQERPVSPKLLAEADRLEALVERVEAISAIKRLQYSYGHYAELGLWDDFADLFADTGIGYYTQGALDREGIRSLFLKDVGQGHVGLADGRIYPHISMQPVVTLAADGQSGKGRWHIMAMLGGYGTSASWAGGVYENQYVRENGVWKFKEVHYRPQYSGRYEDAGWKPTNEPAPFDFAQGKPILDSGLVARGSGLAEPQSLATLAARMVDLTARAQRLSDEIEVANLQHEYGYYADRKMWDDVAALFATDGTLEMGLQGVYAGRASIRRGLNPSTTLGASALPSGLAAGEVNDHIHLQTIVTVLPGGTARARGAEIGMTGTIGGRALWSQSIYENTFVKQGGVWKIKAMHVYPRFIVDAEKGWAKDAQPAPGPSREFPPDRPPTETYEIYPRFSIAPLHFDHPVTGRAPQYPEGMKAAPTVRPVASGFIRTSPVPVKTPAALASLIAATERSVERSKAYHAVENLDSAYGYDIDAKSTNVLTLHQIVQPVIKVSADGRSAKIRTRLFQLGNRASGEGVWTSGIYEGSAVDEGGTWKLAGMKLETLWTAPSRGGWVRATTSPTRVLVRHDFTESAQGWSISGDTDGADPIFRASGGHPGGYITGVDEALGETWYFRAPAAVLQQLPAAVNGTLSYSLRQSGAQVSLNDDDVVILGRAGRLSYRFRTAPGTDWTDFAVQLSESGGWTWNWNRRATQAQIEQILTAPVRLEIRGEYVTGPDEGSLDSFVLTAKSP